MEDEEQPIELRRYLDVLRRRAWVIALCGLVFSIAGFLISSQQTTLYAAVAKVRILDPNTEAVFDANNVRTDPQREVQTQRQVASSGPVRAEADKQLGERASQVSEVSVSNVPETDILSIRVESPSPEVARDAANAIADSYVEFRRNELVATYEARARETRKKVEELEAERNALPEGQRTLLNNQIAELSRKASEQEIEARARGGNAQVVQYADLPTSPFDPQPIRSGLIAGFIGLLAGLVLVLLLDRLDDKVKADTAERIADAPLLGMIRLYRARRLRRHHLPSLPREILLRDSDEAELFRSLRTSLRFSSLGKDKRRIMVTSPSGSEGKSTITANLAVTLTESNLRVVAISADLRRPTLGGFFDLDDTGPGLTSVLIGDRTVAEVAQRVPTEHGALYVIPAGSLPSNPAELLESEQMGEVLDWLIEAGADYVLIDCPPVLPVTDPAVLARYVDAAIMVCVPGQTREADLAEACERLRRVGGDIIGVVVNGLPAGPRYGHAYASYHGGYNTAPMSVPSRRSRDLRDHPTSNGQQTAAAPASSASELAGRRAE